MSAEDNKALVRRFYEAANEHDPEAMVALCTPDYVHHFPGLPEPIRGRDAFKQANEQLFTSFPDCHFTLEEVIAEGDTVANRLTFRATHTGAYQGLPPTGRAVTMAGNDVYHIIDGQIAEEWSQPDVLGLLQQLGIAPAPASAAP